VLAADLKAKLDAMSLLDTFLGAVAGPASTLGSVAPPLSSSQVSAGANLSAGVSTTGISGSISIIGGQTTGLLGGLPDPLQTLRPITAVLEMAESVTKDDPSAQIQAFLDRMTAMLSAPPHGSFLDLLAQAGAMVSSAPELKGIIDLLRTVFGAAQLDFDPFQTLAEVPIAFAATIRAVGGLMGLKSLLAEADRLTRIMAQQLDPQLIGSEVAALRGKFADGAATLAAFSAAGGADPDQARLAVDITNECGVRLAETSALIARSLGFGEATLVHLDLAGLKVDLQAASSLLRTTDPDLIQRAVKSVVDRVAPALNLPLRPAAAQTLDAFLQMAQDQVSSIASAVSAVDVGALADPLKAGLASLTSVADALASAITQVTSAIRAALEQIRQLIARLPFDEIGRSVQSALTPVTQAMDAIGGLVRAAEDALKTVGQTVTAALEALEKAVDTAKGDLQKLFAAAHDFLGQLHLDQASGEIAGNIHAFTDVLAKAQMKPYFDTATGAVNTAADVISAVPLAMLPDSMKADLDAAVAPVRAINVEQVKDEIDGLLEIQGGKFELRGSLEQAIAEIKQDYDALIADLKTVDPRQLVAPIDSALGDVKSKIDGLLPQLNLKPLDDAIASIKQALGSFDLRKELAPISQVFAQVLAAVDEFSPDKLVKPLEDRIKTVRERLVGAIALRQWGPQLDVLAAQARSMIDYLDPQRLGLEEAIAQALGEANLLAAQLDSINLWAPFGDLVAAMLGGSGANLNSSAFDSVVRWLAGAPGGDELTRHATAIATAIGSTRDAVQRLDLSGLSAALAQNVSAMRTAAAGLPAAASVRATLVGATGALDIDFHIASLAGNQGRYLGELANAATLVATISDTGLSQSDATIAALKQALAPAAILADFRDRLLSQVGLGGASGGVAALLRTVLATVTPARLTGILTPMITAVHGRFVALLNAVITPLKDAVNHFTAAIDAISLEPLRTALNAVFQQMRGQIEALDPINILAPTLAAFDKLKAELAAFDPLKNLRDIIAALTSTADRVIAKLHADAILAEPIAIFDAIVKALSAIDPHALLEPVLDALDQVAAQVEGGLDELAKAIERLQAALPAPGGGGVGAAIGAAISVGVSL